MQLQERASWTSTPRAHLPRTFRVPEAFGAPITLRHLMTHTAGFEDVGIGNAALSPPGPDFLSAYLDRPPSARVRPPGSVVMYSNHGAALAGPVVEEVSGTPFETTSTSAFSFPWGWRERASDSRPRSRPFVPGAGVRTLPGRRPSDHVRRRPPGPGGRRSATAEDMAAFMVAHLEGGVARGGILSRLRPSSSCTVAPSVRSGGPGMGPGVPGALASGAADPVPRRLFPGVREPARARARGAAGPFRSVQHSGGSGLWTSSSQGSWIGFVPPGAEVAAGPAAGSAGTARGMGGTVPAGLYVPARRPYTTIEKLNRPARLAAPRPPPEATLQFLGRGLGARAGAASMPTRRATTCGGPIRRARSDQRSGRRKLHLRPPACLAAPRASLLVARLARSGLLLSYLVLGRSARRPRRTAAAGAGGAPDGWRARWPAPAPPWRSSPSPACSSCWRLRGSRSTPLALVSFVPSPAVAAAPRRRLLAGTCWVRGEGSVGERVYLSLVAASLAATTSSWGLRHLGPRHCWLTAAADGALRWHVRACRPGVSVPPAAPR